MNPPINFLTRLEILLWDRAIAFLNQSRTAQKSIPLLFRLYETRPGWIQAGLAALGCALAFWLGYSLAFLGGN